MMKAIGVDVVGKKLCLFYNIDAWFLIEEKYGDDFLSAMSASTKEGMDMLLDIAAILTEQGELARHYHGYPKGDVLSPEDRSMMTLADILDLKTAVFAAVSLGIDRDVPPLDDTDLTLIEIEKEFQKKTNKE